MLHFGEVFSAEIYARGGIVVGGVKRAEGSFETMGFKWRFFLPFFSLLKRKGKHSAPRGEGTPPYNKTDSSL